MDEKLRKHVCARAKARCEYCLIPQHLDDLPFEIDHIIAIKHEGETTSENLALSCYYCNAYKGPNIAGLDTETNQVTQLFHPRNDTWVEHFRWQSGVLVGLTEVGRATITVLRMNLPERVALREAFIEEGLFPD